MGWTGIRDHAGGRVLRNVTGVVETGLLARGTLLVEARARGVGRDHDQLVDVAIERGWDSGFRLTLTPRRFLEIEAVTGHNRIQHRLNLGTVEDGTLVRVTYSWNGPARTGLLTAELPEQGRIHQLEVLAPPPLAVADLHGLVSCLHGAQIGTGVLGVAVADQVEPVGLAPGFARGTTIETEGGPRRIDRLQLGDRVMTADGRALPVRWITRRILPAIGSLAPVTVPATWFGATETMVLPPLQRVLVSGPDAQREFGLDATLVAARDLPVAGVPRPADQDGAEVAWYNVLLDEHACIRVGGLWAESLFAGTIAKHPEILATTPLGPLPSGALPLHRQVVQATVPVELPAAAPAEAPLLLVRRA
ncbi:MAG: Hint domain-containing protein [Rhodobacteraceae bacterium]|jgi:hypothetical protein|nr:Hint domain-containing protein [Paracoccaceae bacterium]